MTADYLALAFDFKNCKDTFMKAVKELLHSTHSLDI